jgi:dienelactone hydrolase
MKIIYAFVFSLLFLISCSERKPEKIGLIEEEVEYSSDGTVMKGFLVYDGDIEGERPGVLVVHEWWGHNEFVRNRARMIAQLGYTALAVDMFGEGKTANHPDDAGKFTSEVFSNIESSQNRFMAAYNLLKEHNKTDDDQIAAVGFCFGGSIVLHMVRIGTDLKAGVSFHGGLSPVTPAEADKVKAFVLVCNGADDPMVTAEQIEAFKEEMESAGVRYEFFNYEDAVHAFTNPDADMVAEEFNIPVGYNEKADKESWEEMKRVLNNVFSE